MPRRHDDKDDAGAKTIDTYYNVTIEAGAEVHIHIPPSANVNVTCSDEVTLGNGAITVTVGSVGAPVPGDGGPDASA